MLSHLWWSKSSTRPYIKLSGPDNVLPGGERDAHRARSEGTAVRVLLPVFQWLSLSAVGERFIAVRQLISDSGELVYSGCTSRGVAADPCLQQPRCGRGSLAAQAEVRPQIPGCTSRGAAVDPWLHQPRCRRRSLAARQTAASVEERHSPRDSDPPLITYTK